MRVASILLISICLLFASSGCSNTNTLNFKKLDLSDLNGNPVDPSSFDGKPLVVSFWATWCGPCLREKPAMNRAREILEKDGFEFLAVSEEPIPTIKRFKERSGYPFTYLKINKNIKLLGVFYIPHTFVFDTKGKLVFSHEGELDWDSKKFQQELRVLGL